MGKMNWLYKVAPFLDSKINFLSRNFRAGDKLLDLGCGDATYLGGILEYAPSLKISAVDVVDFKSKMPQGVDFFLVDISKDKLPFADNYFSGIFVNHVIEHLSNPHFAIKECARVLKQGGLVYIETH